MRAVARSPEEAAEKLVLQAAARTKVRAGFKIRDLHGAAKAAPLQSTSKAESFGNL